MSKKNRPQASTPAKNEPLPLWPLIVGFIGAAWVFVLFLGFYKNQPFPLTLILKVILPDDLVFPTASVILYDIVGLLWGFAFLFSAIFIGRLILSRFTFVWKSSLETLVVAAGLGYGVLAYATLALGEAGFLYKSVFRFGILALALGAFFWFSRESERSLLSGAFQEKKQLYFSSGRNFVLTLLLVFISLTVLIMSFTPELFYDALVYHLGAPNFYLHEHRIAPIDLMTTKFPFTVQMLHVIGLALRDETVTRLTQCFCLFLVIGGLMALGIRAGRPRWGLISATLFACIPTVWMNALTSGVDIGVTLFGFLAGLTLLISLDDENGGKWRRLSAVFAGFALGSKYTAAPTVAALGLGLIVLLFWQKKSVAEILKEMILFGVISLAVFSPWLFKNFHETGNPLYPFLTKTFGGLPLAPWRYDLLKGENDGLLAKSFLDFLLIPWKLCTSERSSLSFQGPLLFGLLPFLALAFKGERPAFFRPLLLISALFLPMAFFMTRLTRYWMPGLPLVCLVVGYGALALYEDRRIVLRAIGYGTILVGFLFQATWVMLILHNSYGPQKILLGQQSREEYISVYHSGMNPNPNVPIYGYLKEQLPPEANVLLIGSESAYPFPVRHSYSGVYDTGPLIRAASEATTPEQIGDKLKAAGFTHVLINVQECYRLAGYGIFGMSPEALGRLSAFWDNHLEFVHVVQAPIGQGYSNPLILAKIVSQRSPSTPPIPPVVAMAYEKAELPRQGIKTPEEIHNFYVPLAKAWPQVEWFKRKLESPAKT